MKKLFRKSGWMLPALALAWLWPVAARAAEESETGVPGLDADQINVLIVLAVVGVAYLVTHLVLERLAERFGFVTGVEYIVLGALVGPVLGLVEPETFRGLAPVVVLGTGSLGLLAGLYFDRKEFDTDRIRALWVAAIISVITLAVMLAVPSAILLQLWEPEHLYRAMPVLMAVAAVAMVADGGPLRSLAALLGAEGRAAEFAAEVARFCSAFAIVAFGLVFCFFNSTSLPFETAPTWRWAVWLGIHLLLGGVLGIIFTNFLRRDFSDEKIITVIIGMVIFTSGVAYYLQLSPIFVNFIMGIVLINTCSYADHVQSRLMSIHRPLYIVLFFFGGAGWSLEANWWGYALVIGYVVLRRFARYLGSFTAGRVAHSSPVVESGLARPLLTPGALSVAMVLNFYGVYEHLDHSHMLHNGLLVAIVLTELFSYPVTRNWLIDVAHVTPSEVDSVGDRDAGEAS
ncbi:MAG: cation:proton antiporter [Persicimonas sp.]